MVEISSYPLPKQRFGACLESFRSIHRNFAEEQGNYKSTSTYLRTEHCIANIEFLQIGMILDTITWDEVQQTKEAFHVIRGNGAEANDITAIAWSFDSAFVGFGTKIGMIHVLTTEDWRLLSPSSD